MFYDLEDKVIVITGSSRGIGAHLIQAIAKEKAKVVLNYNKSEKEAAEIAMKISEYNKHVIKVKADITKAEEVKYLYRKTIEEYGKVDVLINNAGISKNNLLFRISEDQWDDVVSTNLKGTFLCSKYFAKSMIRQKKGKIINIASLLGVTGCAGQSNYSASKAGVIALTKSIAKEIGKWNISVNAICPGYVPTDLENGDSAKQFDISSQKPEVNDYLSNVNYLDALTNFVIFMCSDLFHSITGQVFHLDSRH